VVYEEAWWCPRPSELISVFNLLVDVLYAVIDPRVRYD